MGKCCCLVFVVIVALVAVGLSIGIPLGIRKAKHAVHDFNQASINAACEATSYPDTCNQTFSQSNNYTHNSAGVTKFSLQSSSTGVNNTLISVLGLNGTNPNVTAAVEVCAEVLQLSMEQLDLAVEMLNSTDATTFASLKSIVSAALELHTTCIDAFLEIAPTDGNALQNSTAHTQQLLSNSLAFINAFAAYGDDLNSWKPTGFSLPSGLNLTDLTHIPLPKIPGFGRKLLSTREEEFPRWVDAQMQRHLLQAPAYNVMVAKDGSGKYTTIQAAVDAAPQKSSSRYVIYIKAGIYDEQVTISKKTTYLTFIGDGPAATIITGSLSVGLTQGMTTFKSATLIVGGKGFIGKSLQVQNTAGSSGHQAVAVRVSADQVAFDNCVIDGWQDTLYAHVFNQFYRDSTIQGTVDFIFGNGAVVFQSCNIIAKKTTLLGQQNTYSAQGRTDPHQNTGLSFQNCTFDGTAALKSDTSGNYQTYLGRPWKAYSVCVIMESDITSVVNPSGWLAWNTSSFGLYTSFFAEYKNFGTGSSTANRVKWSHIITSASTANTYQAENFIEAASWVPSTNIPLTTSL